MQKQGIQGSYNQKLSMIEELNKFAKDWKEELIQELHYSEKELNKWRTFANKES